MDGGAQALKKTPSAGLIAYFLAQNQLRRGVISTLKANLRMSG
jgi:hypothetical protein